VVQISHHSASIRTGTTDTLLWSSRYLAASAQALPEILCQVMLSPDRSSMA
jgi:hypothetical protein